MSDLRKDRNAMTGDERRERPILFSGEMVRAILEGRKTQTRRVCKDQLGPTLMDDCPYGEAPELLWVRETFLPDPPIDGWDGDISWNGCGRPISGVPAHYRKPEHCIFAATWEGSSLRWRPAIHMPRWACRITLKITDVRVERVQEISAADVEAEGVVRYRREFGQDGGFPEGWKDSRPGYGGSVWVPSAFKDAYRVLWDPINEKRGFGFNENPFVWVIEFQRSGDERRDRG